MEALHHSTARQLREALGEGRIGAEELVRGLPAGASKNTTAG